MKSSRNRSGILFFSTFFRISATEFTKRRPRWRRRRRKIKTYHNIWQTITLISVHKLLFRAFCKTSHELCPYHICEHVFVIMLLCLLLCIMIQKRNDKHKNEKQKNIYTQQRLKRTELNRRRTEQFRKGEKEEKIESNDDGMSEKERRKKEIEQKNRAACSYILLPT